VSYSAAMCATMRDLHRVHRKADMESTRLKGDARQLRAIVAAMSAGRSIVHLLSARSTANVPRTNFQHDTPDCQMELQWLFIARLLDRSQRPQTEASWRG